MTPRLLAALSLSAALACAAAPVSHYDGGRVPPVHRLAPLDAEGDRIVLLGAFKLKDGDSVRAVEQ